MPIPDEHDGQVEMKTLPRLSVVKVEKCHLESASQWEELSNVTVRFYLRSEDHRVCLAFSKP